MSKRGFIFLIWKVKGVTQQALADSKKATELHNAGNLFTSMKSRQLTIGRCLICSFVLPLVIRISLFFLEKKVLLARSIRSEKRTC